MATHYINDVRAVRRAAQIERDQYEDPRSGLQHLIDIAETHRVLRACADLEAAQLRPAAWSEAAVNAALDVVAEGGRRLRVTR